MYICNILYIYGQLLVSFQANHKISAAKLHYDIYALSQRLRLTTIRVEYEEAVRNNYTNSSQGKGYVAVQGI